MPCSRSASRCDPGEPAPCPGRARLGTSSGTAIERRTHSPSMRLKSVRGAPLRGRGRTRDADDACRSGRRRPRAARRGTPTSTTKQPLGLEVSRGGVRRSTPPARSCDRQVADRVEDEVDERERPLDGACVAKSPIVTARARAPPGCRAADSGDHVRTRERRVHRGTGTPRCRRAAARVLHRSPIRELERGTVARERREEARPSPATHCGSRRARRDARRSASRSASVSADQTLDHPDRFSFPCFFA